MKKLLFICVAFGLYKAWGHFNTNSHSYSEDNVVILYATDWCGYCAKTREFFADNNIAYYEYDIEKSAQGREQYDELNGNGVPLVDINGNIIRGYSESKMHRFLN